MEFDYRFPLFDSIIQGNLNPLLAQNVSTADYNLLLAEQIIDSAQDEGLYAIHFPKHSHPKQKYYLRLLLNETYAYCNDLTAYLEAETDANIRAYLRDKILDKHITTCLKRLGELISKAELTINYLYKPSLCSHVEDYYNAWILHLLKVCLAKAYLEVQVVLSDVVITKQSETMLYSTHLKEIPPINSFLTRKKREQKQAPEQVYSSDAPRLDVAAEPQATIDKPISSKPSEEMLLVKEASVKLRMSERSVSRKLTSGEIEGVKTKGRWLIPKSAIDKYLNRI